MVEPNGKAFEKAILPQQTMAALVQRCRKSNGQPVSSDANEFHLYVEKIGLLGLTSDSAERITPS
jgi:hypothetical protein